MKINSIIFYLQLFLSISLISYYSFLDLKESEKTEYIVDSFERLNLEKYYFYLAGKSIDELNEDEIPLNFNKGRIFLFGSLPMSKGFTSKLIINETIIIKNDGTFQLY